VKKKLLVFTIDTLEQAEKVILESKNYTLKPILHLKKYILRGFGSDFIINFKNALDSKFGNSSYKIFTDCGNDPALSINMITKDIQFIKLKGKIVILSKIENIAKKNMVVLNPTFNVVDCRNRKNIKSKLKKIYTKSNK
jgi:hypothetical protein